MKIELTEHELTHLVTVLKLDLKEKSKDIRRVNFDTDESLVERRIIAYNRTKDLLQRVDEWRMAEAKANKQVPIEDDTLFRI
jgi:hypothetical protein